MEKGHLKRVVLEHWGPAAISGVLGLFVGLTVSLFDAKTEKNQFFFEMQARTAERVANNFSLYVGNWRRIVVLKDHFESNGIPPDENAKKALKLYVDNRDAARDQLFTALDASMLFMAESSRKVIREFREWDREQAHKKLDRLPPMSHWNKHQERILLAMRKDIVE